MSENETFAYELERDGERRVITKRRVVELYEQMLNEGWIAEEVDDPDNKFLERVWSEAMPIGKE